MIAGVDGVQIVQLTEPAEHPYGSKPSKYQGQSGPTASEYVRNFDR